MWALSDVAKISSPCWRPTRRWIILIIDDREHTQHPELSEIIGIEHRIERLDTADYAFLDRNGSPVGIERCEIGNLIQKLRSGELEDQLYRCQESFPTTILLKEGVYDYLGGLLAIHKQGERGYFRSYVYPRTTYESIKAMEVRLSEMGVEIVDTANFACSMLVVRVIYQQRTKAEDKHTLFKRVRVPKFPTKLTTNPTVPRLMALVPRIPEATAIALVHKFDTIWNIIHAEDKALLEVQGMGKGLVRKLRESLGKED